MAMLIAVSHASRESEVKRRKAKRALMKSWVSEELVAGGRWSIPLRWKLQQWLLDVSANYLAAADALQR